MSKFNRSRTNVSSHIKPLILFALLALFFTYGSFAEEVNQDTGFHTPLTPSGRVYLAQGLKHDNLVFWDFGAFIQGELLNGHGNRLWFGAGYRSAAGFAAGQTVTPFDPRHIDSYQLLTWSKNLVSDNSSQSYPFVAYIDLYRVCYHEIDIYNSGAPFMTRMNLGVGSFSPAEEGSGLGIQRSQRSNTIGGYLGIGPFIHGGPMSILGNTPTWQGEANIYLLASHRIGGNYHLFTSLRGKLLLRSPSADRRTEQHLSMRFGALLQGRGDLKCFLEHTFHDSYPIRPIPLGSRVGIEFQF